MKILASAALLCLLSFAVQAQSAKASGPAGPAGNQAPKPAKPLPPSIYPEQPPEGKAERAEWLIKWVARNRFTIAGLSEVISYVKERQTSAKQEYAEAKADTKASAEQVRYLKHMAKWYDDQKVLLDSIMGLSMDLTRLAGDPANTEKVSAEQASVKELARNFGTLRKNRPAEPK